ncbi:2OG-Fe dioxygenase family protein [Serratia marcescens]|uniref:2OG-Fe dioxygenase family protein n=1 Tax=Serratia marcescens TaxID=615 RepID=A0A939SUK5_SERMA|nr:2OG-Fe dioxygenase family protein [Serratia marcescens]
MVPPSLSTAPCCSMAEMCNLFAENNELPEGAEIEIHQMRVVAIQKDTLVAPEGIHQTVSTISP